MNSKTIQHMQYFVGRVVSIVSSSMNRAFDEQTAREHFAIRVRDISLDGIWGAHPYNEEMISFFAMAHIISVHEEVELNPDNPEHAAMIEEYEKKSGKKLAGDLKKPKVEAPKKMSLDVLQETPLEPDDSNGDTTFIDIENLENIAEQTAQSYAIFDSK